MRKIASSQLSLNISERNINSILNTNVSPDLAKKIIDITVQNCMRGDIFFYGINYIVAKAALEVYDKYGPKSGLVKSEFNLTRSEWQSLKDIALDRMSDSRSIHG